MSVLSVRYFSSRFLLILVPSAFSTVSFLRNNFLRSAIAPHTVKKGTGTLSHGVSVPTASVIRNFQAMQVFI